jgi:transcriptional regulator with XRE-family HTH domain
MRLWRIANRVTLNALAGKVGVSASHLSEIERGLDTPSVDLTTKLSRATAGGEGDPAVTVQAIVEAAPVREAAE